MVSLHNNRPTTNLRVANTGATFRALDRLTWGPTILHVRLLNVLDKEGYFRTVCVSRECISVL